MCWQGGDLDIDMDVEVMRVWAMAGPERERGVHGSMSDKL